MLKELEDSDWGYAFEYAGETVKYGGYGSADISPALPNDDVSVAPFTREDVAELTAYSEGGNDGPDWLAAGKLKDGRYFLLASGCDYTGWD